MDDITGFFGLELLPICLEVSAKKITARDSWFL
jgi:hypothetical protein